MLLSYTLPTYGDALKSAHFQELGDKANQYLIVYCDREGNPLPITRKREVVCFRLRKVAR
jgi:hypothetical protein